MDFLKSAVGSAISKGPEFGYTPHGPPIADESIWTLRHGTKKADHSRCSIFSFDVALNKSRLPLARNALKKLRTVRHPGIIKVLDVFESDAHLYIATEPLEPLRCVLDSLPDKYITLGLYSLARTLKFINDDATLLHGNIKVASVYVTEAQEWKLGGFELLTSLQDEQAVIYRYGTMMPDYHRYAPPEVEAGGWDAIRRNPHYAVDSFNFGLLLFEVFNKGKFEGSSQAGQTRNVPSSMHVAYRRLVKKVPQERQQVGHFLEQGLQNGSFFDTELIRLNDALDTLSLKSPEELEPWLDLFEGMLDDHVDKFTPNRVLPALLNLVEYGGGGARAVSIAMKIASRLGNDDFVARVMPVVPRLFAKPDRAIRVCLLENLPQIIDRLPKDMVNKQIFPQLVTGFTDTEPLVREQTIKSILTVITKLSDHTINGDLLRYLAKTANDEQPGIRTNTTICLGKIAKHLGTSTRSKVLSAAFTRALRDPFVHARNAALMALAATAEHFSDEDCACKIMPIICPLLMDKEKLIRNQALATLELYLRRIRKAVENMPDSKEPGTATETVRPRLGTPQASGIGDASSWTGWAISSFTNKFSSATGIMETNTAPATTVNSDATMARPDVSNSPLRYADHSVKKQDVPSGTSNPHSRILRTESSASGIASAFVQSDRKCAGSYLGEGDKPNDEANNADDADDSAAVWDFEQSPQPTNTQTKQTPAASLSMVHDGEPDFAAWLLAKSAKKTGVTSGGKPMPKGLTRSTGTSRTPSSTGGTKTAAAKKPVAKPKEVNLKPRDDEDENDGGWGDEW